MALLRWLETRVDPFAPFDDRATPPAGVGTFAWHYLRPVRGWMALLLAVSLTVGLFESGLYILSGWFVDLLATRTPAELWAAEGTRLVAAGLAIVLFRPALMFAHELIANQLLTPQLTNQIRWRTHLYTLRHALAYFQGDFAGRLANRVVQVGPAIREVAIEVLDSLVYVAVFALTALGLFSTISAWLALPMALWIAGYMGLLAWFVPRAQRRSLAVADRRSALIGRIVDSYTNIQTVKLFARTEAERSSVQSSLVAHTIAFLASFRLVSVATGLLGLLNSLLLAATAAVALRLWSHGGMSAGEAAAGLALVMRIMAMSGWVMQVVRGVFENVGVVQESMETIARPHQVVDAPAARTLHVSRGAIRFEAVRFHYGRETGIIDDLTLHVPGGQKLGLVGPSGAGKTTLTNLLLRLHDLEGGRVLIDGQDIALCTQDSLRAQVGVVTQDTSLLHRSIAENIAYGRLDATREQVERAAKLAHAHEFILDLEDHKGRRGYDARVGERGVKLSGGQRQRIAIARVLLKDAPILVLDEATSALDSELEASIQDALARLMQGKTVVVIAHRLSTIASLDRLVVLDHGRIVEEGTHADLIDSGGLYARLWRRQSGGFLAATDEARAAA